MEEDNNMNIIEFQKGLESTPTPAPAPAPAPALVSVPVGASSFSEMNCNMELLMNNISEHLNQPLISSQLLDYFSTDSFLNHPNMSSSRQPHHHQHQHQQQSSLFCSNYDHQQQQQQQQQQQNDYYIQRHGKNVVGPSSPGFAGSESGADYKIDKFDGIGRKRKRKTEGKGEKLKEVIHVRAKRGQATDSHSLAERVRRERINEKLKVLQDLVPGCYKTMAMAAMLDVIINYVRSLQNQIEFLSMKLSAASMVYDFNSPEAEAFETLLRTTTNPYEAHEAERPGREEYRGTIPRSHTTWPF